MPEISKSGFGPSPLLLTLLAVGLVLAGCAGAPEIEQTPEAEPPAAPTASETILDAKAYAQNSDFETAATMLEDLIEREGENIEAMKLLTSVYAAMGRRTDAVSIWKRISILDPSDGDAAYEVGIALARAKDWAGVRSKMLATESYGALDRRHYLLLGEADYELGYIGEAEKYLKRAVPLERAHYLLGKLYYNRDELGEAENAFTEVLQRNPENYSAHLHLGWLNFRKGNHLKALKHYKKALRFKPKDPLALFSLAALLEEMGRPDQAIEHYIKALSVAGTPRSEKKKAYNSLSRILVASGRTEEALSFIEKGLAEFPDSGGLYYQWGEALLREGKKREAKEKFKRAAEDPIWREVALRRIHAIP